ncbi:MAG TPA: MerR family transcriptional regulator, partial [Anaeromyxobacteraceae bacterium]
SPAEFNGRFRELLRSQVEQARRRLDRLRRLKRELEAALATIESRLGPRGEDVEGDSSPRIVRLISSGELCGRAPSRADPIAGEAAAAPGSARS